MNVVLLRFSLIIIGLTAFVFLFTKFAPDYWIQRVYKVATWSIEKSFLFFVDIMIFLKPLKKYREKVGLFLWLFFVILIGRYMIVQQPLITEIQSPYIPFIGYIYILSVFYIIKIILDLFAKKATQGTEIEETR